MAEPETLTRRSACSRLARVGDELMFNVAVYKPLLSVRNSILEFVDLPKELPSLELWVSSESAIVDMVDGPCMLISSHEDCIKSWICDAVSKPVGIGGGVGPGKSANLMAANRGC